MRTSRILFHLAWLHVTLLLAAGTGQAQSPQPTSIAFNVASVYAGADGYTVTLRDANNTPVANIDVDEEYTLNGDTTTCGDASGPCYSTTAPDSFQ